MIVPARDAEATLPRTLAALAAQSLDGGVEVIVVDDGSTDRTAALAREAGVRVVSQPALGPAPARNHGAQEASSDLLAFCDADVFPAPGWLAAGVEALRQSELVQGRVLPDPSVPLGPFDRSIWVTTAPGLWETANLFVRRELFDRLGGFEEWLRPSSGKALAEDVWFGYRALRAGASFTFCEQALAHHAVFERDWREYASERLRLRYFPAMARKTPELRGTFLYRRVFLNRRTARFDLALAGGVLALACRSRLPAVLALPYVRTALNSSKRGGCNALAVAAADLAADAVSLSALMWGSLQYRSPVL